MFRLLKNTHTHVFLLFPLKCSHDQALLVFCGMRIVTVLEFLKNSVWGFFFFQNTTHLKNKKKSLQYSALLLAAFVLVYFKVQTMYSSEIGSLLGTGVCSRVRGALGICALLEFLWDYSSLFSLVVRCFRVAVDTRLQKLCVTYFNSCNIKRAEVNTVFTFIQAGVLFNLPSHNCTIKRLFFPSLLYLNSLLSSFKNVFAAFMFLCCCSVSS